MVDVASFVENDSLVLFDFYQQLLVEEMYLGVGENVPVAVIGEQNLRNLVVGVLSWPARNRYNQA